MNQVPLLFLGCFAAMAASFWGLVIVPQVQVGRKEAIKVEDTGGYYPAPKPGAAQAGAGVYRSLGCVECHTQQVGPKEGGYDSLRGWGRRRTVAEDYLRDEPVQLGSFRLGPDLTNVGRRQPAVVHHLQHLYNPRLVTPESIMPRYPFLFTRRVLAQGEKPSNPLALPAGTDPGHEVVPTEQALQLAAYLGSLSADVPIFSAPFPVTKTNAPAAKAGASVP